MAKKRAFVPLGKVAEYAYPTRLIFIVGSSHLKNG